MCQVALMVSILFEYFVKILMIYINNKLVQERIICFKFQVSILLDSLVSRQGMYKNTKHIYTIANNKHEKYSC